MNGLISEDYLMHHGVKGMKWGVRKDYRPTSIRSAIARRQNAKVDKGFKKWNEGANNKQTAIDAGKKRNASKIAYEKDRSNKELKAQYKSDNKAYKQALRKNTTYRKGSVREEVGKDLSRNYMTEAKRAKKSGDMKTYSNFMNKHDVERAKARKAQSVGQKRSAKKAGIKRAATMTVKAAALTGAVTAGAYAAQKYGGVNVSSDQLRRAAGIGKTAMRYAGYFY